MVSKMQGPPGVGNLTRCRYNKYSRGSAAAAVSDTTTAWIPQSQQEANEWVVMGVECTTKGGTGSYLNTTRVNDWNGLQYRCVCFGNGGQQVAVLVGALPQLVVSVLVQQLQGSVNLLKRLGPPSATYSYTDANGNATPQPPSPQQSSSSDSTDFLCDTSHPSDRLRNIYRRRQNPLNESHGSDSPTPAKSKGRQCPCAVTIVIALLAVAAFIMALLVITGTTTSRGRSNAQPSQWGCQLQKDVVKQMQKLAIVEGDWQRLADNVTSQVSMVSKMQLKEFNGWSYAAVTKCQQHYSSVGVDVDHPELSNNASGGGSGPSIHRPTTSGSVGSFNSIHNPVLPVLPSGSPAGVLPQRFAPNFANGNRLVRQSPAPSLQSVNASIWGRQLSIQKLPNSSSGDIKPMAIPATLSGEMMKRPDSLLKSHDCEELPSSRRRQNPLYESHGSDSPTPAKSKGRQCPCAVTVVIALLAVAAFIVALLVIRGTTTSRDDIERDINIANRSGSLTPLLQVIVTLRYYASGSFQDVCSELIGIDQSTVSRTVTRVTDAFLRQVPNHVRLPNQRQADRMKAKFYYTNGFPNVVGSIDGTQICIQAPSENEHAFINRKGYHSINVQVMCDEDLLFINYIAKWPGSVHDARVLRESSLFDAFESELQSL
ncbi:hypothetical protein LSAT2_019259 [Lamellibrachia satsuma]|nr:hypothetical protein LSAT2_019259 [Lamellibrachia satsuma]